MSALYWNDVKQMASLNQDGSSGYPPPWVMKHLEDNLDLAPLRFGGEDYGYLLWLRPQGKRVVEGMRVLKGALVDYDDALAQIADLQARLAALASPSARAAEPPSETARPVLSTQQADRVGSGLDAYELRVSGLAWPEIGRQLGLGSPLNAAKKHAKANSLPWPPTSV